MDKRNSDTYYDIEIEFEEALLKSGFVEDVFYLRDLKQRKLFISTNICQETVDDAIRHIMQINREDMGVAREDRKPIILYVTSNGGDVDAGFALIDVILTGLSVFNGFPDRSCRPQALCNAPCKVPDARRFPVYL